VPTPVNSQHVDERLEELYRRHLLVGEDSVANYYESGRGYYKPELAAEERERFSISSCVPTARFTRRAITTDRSPYSLSQRCSSTALLWRTTEETMS
jgi:hypothetical protein